MDPRRDGLTGLRNDLAFVEDLQAAARAVGPLGVLLLDIDGLGRLNGALGRDAGDAALGAAAAVLAACPDLAAYRFGGDEFCALAGTLEAPRLAEGLVTAFHEVTARGGTPATCTVGFAFGPGPCDPAELLWRAEGALWAGKAAGGARAVGAGPRGGDEAAGMRLLGRLMRRLVETLHELQEWHAAALTDPVTGLPNHRHARDALAAAVREAATHTGRVSVVFIDGDGLRRLNTLSYEAGNALIGRLGRLLLAHTRPPAVLGRWFSGDEFLLVLPGADSRSALEVAGALCEAVRRHGAAWELPVTISAGVATFPDHGADEDALLTAAYAACGAAKRWGKDRAVLATPGALTTSGAAPAERQGLARPASASPARGDRPLWPQDRAARP